MDVAKLPETETQKTPSPFDLRFQLAFNSLLDEKLPRRKLQTGRFVKLFL
jgi:hypothetical protein